MNEGASFQKAAWAWQLEYDGYTTDLEWSPDLRGLLWTMPGSLIVMLATLAAARVKR